MERRGGRGAPRGIPLAGHGYILELVANATMPVPLFRYIEFLTDGLLCEWAYVLDLDETVLEVYDNGPGGDREREWERFKGVEGLENARYLPSMVGSWNFEGLPDENTFVDSCYEGGVGP